jgi:hypothetical protein
LLKTSIQEERSDYDVVPPGAIKGQLGDAFAPVFATFSSTGSVDQAGLEMLSNYKGARYVAFCIIESDSVANTRAIVNDLDKNGKAIPGTEKIRKTADRTVTANLSIYDVRSKMRVWTGSVSKMLPASQDYAPAKTNLLVDIVKAAQKTEEPTDDQKYPPPTAQTSDQVLAQVFRGFAENMPKK